MKKTVILLITAALLVTACNEQDTNQQPTPEMTQTRETEPPQTRPALTVTHETEPPQTRPAPIATHDTEEPQLDEFAMINAFQFDWMAGVETGVEAVLIERLWTTQYEEHFGVTVFEAIKLLRAAQRGSTSCEEFDAIACEIVIAYCHTMDVAGGKMREIVEDLHFVRSRAHPRGEAWYLANHPPFLEIFNHFNITREEFVREHERRLKLLDAIDAEGGETIFARYMVFPIEHVDVLFSGDDTAIKRAALNPWSIMVEDRVYSVQWFIDNSPADWAEADIPIEAIVSVYETLQATLDEFRFTEFEAEFDVFRREYATR